MLLSEPVKCVAVTFKMTEWVEQWVWIKLCIRLEFSSVKLFMWFRRPQLWATGDWQLRYNDVPVHAFHAEFFSELSNHPGDSAAPKPTFGTLRLLPFPKLESPLKGKRFQTIDEIHENITGQLMVTGRTVWGPNVPTLKGTEASLSYVQCFLYFVSSSINVNFS